MEAFLSRVANTYLTNCREELADCCFVFPNKRAGVFFRHYLLQNSQGNVPLIEPQVLTISEFIAEWADASEATRFEQLFALYDVYTGLGAIDTTFDKFLYWGEMLISDFNDIDRQLVDPDHLFVNVKRLKEINSNYLTQEQRRLIKRYWGEERRGDEANRFWSHVADAADGAKDTLSDKFLMLWEVLAPMYHGFTQTLRSRGLATQGMLTRYAVDALRKADRLPQTRYVFVGFNVLSVAEIKIFEILKARGQADFYWDFNSPAFEIEGNKAVKFMQNNVREFPSLYDICEEPITAYPQITVAGISSACGMAKAAGTTLEEWVKSKAIPDANDAIETAIVLPDESQFITLIHSLPDEIRDVNITMGFPLRGTAIADLVGKVIALHLKSRHDTEGRQLFIYDDIRSLANHPILQAIAPDECYALLQLISERRLYTVPAQLIAETVPEMGYLLSPVDLSAGITPVYNYFRNMLTHLLEVIDPEQPQSMEQQFIEGYLEALDELYSGCTAWNIEIGAETFFTMIDRAVASAAVNFKGEPLKGLQIMGVLETRCLDFDNVIILSMNEDVFPKKHYTKSFIPEALRHAYGLATEEFQESIYAYYFYRLISRAKNVTLLYDTRDVGATSGEMSRYIKQLIYMTPQGTVTHRSMIYAPAESASMSISIGKDSRILKLLERFTSETGEDKRYLSASAINTYISCPLNFYLQYVEGISTDDEFSDYMSSSIYGTIVHQVVQLLYERERDRRGSGVLEVTDSLLDSWIDSNVTIDSIIVESINQHYLNLGEGCLQPLIGECRILGDIIATFIKAMLRNEKKLTPFTFVRAEEKITGRWKVTPSLTVNIKQYIDRVDRTPKGIRLIDFKTGADKLTFADVDALFNPVKSDRRKAILQLLFYCNAYAEKHHYTGAIQPVIYQFQKMVSDGISPVKYGKSVLTDYKEVNDEFLDRFNAVVSEIFDPEVPFGQAKKDDSCGFCKFNLICGRKGRGKF